MGQFEYSVDLSRVMPEDVERVAREYKEKKARESAMKLIPLEDKVIVKPIKEPETTTASGFIIQRNSDEKPSEGIVEAVGPGIVFPNGTKLEIDLKPGDKVAYSKYSGTEIDEYLILPYKDIFAVIEEA
jgi:chaperonin GroES